MSQLRYACLIAVLCAVVRFSDAAEKSPASLTVRDGMRVSLEYTLKDENGKLIESNKGQPPLVYTHGAQEMIPGLERELAGMRVGASKHVTVKPQDAYGLVDYNKFKEVPKSQIPASGMKAGAELARPDDQGRMRMFKVHEVREDTVVLDLNHPMAGKTLVFDVKIVDIQPSRAAASPSTPQPPKKSTQAK